MMEIIHEPPAAPEARATALVDSGSPSAVTAHRRRQQICLRKRKSRPSLPRDKRHIGPLANPSLSSWLLSLARALDPRPC